MNNSSPTASCHPTSYPLWITVSCIISCFVCTVVMIWGVYAMRADMREMQAMNMSNSMPPMYHSKMDMSDPMSMSMRDMSTMLAGKTGDDLDRAFLEGMIPHHQGAVDMAQYLIHAKRPELQKMGQDIISAQEKEIAQMKQWMIDWGYTESAESPEDEMNYNDSVGHLRARMEGRRVRSDRTDQGSQYRG